MLKIYNTLTRKKETFRPVMKDKVRMYVCGPTVYNYISIGNARPVIVFNMVRNYLEYLGYEVIYVQNVTDIDDKIIRKANEENVDFKTVASKYIKAFTEDIKSLKVSSFTRMPLASEMIEDIINIIQRIIENGYGYVAGGNVFFDVRKFDRNYGKLSGQNIEEMESQEGDIFGKKDKVDFALWKSAKPGEPYWNSPWGKGRPGWHIECTAMATKYLGHGIDIHGGGMDLIFPHHENEIAQAEAAFPGKGAFVKYWMHNGMIEVREEKMSKSAGLEENWILRNLLKSYSHNVIKMYMLTTHYRSPLEFNEEKLEESRKALERLINTLVNIRFLIESYKQKSRTLHMFQEHSSARADSEIDSMLDKCHNDFVESMNDDFNSAKALSHLFELVKKVNSIIQSADFVMADSMSKTLERVYNMINELGVIFGFDFEEEIMKITSRTGDSKDIDREEIERLIRLRQEARKNKDFKLADEIRDELYEKGIILEDRREGTIWKVREKE
ncbi:MAG: cysteine--tRNA ligase [Actinobacteria bacterium]|nr:cysteine--tRNA ligase [Actinomycetota bacterium]